MSRVSHCLRRASSLLLALLCAAGCGAPDADAGRTDARGDVSLRPDAGDAGSDAASERAAFAVSASVRPNPNMVVSAYVDVVAPGALDVLVRHGDDTTYGYVTRPVAVDGAGRATVTLIGLRPGARTELEVVARAPDGTSASSGNLAFEAAALPATLGLPDLEIRTDDGSATGFVLGCWVTPTGRNALMLDRRGRVMWYRPLLGDSVGVLDRLANGHFILWRWETLVNEELDLGGEVVRTWSQGPAVSSDGIDPHEFLELPDGHAAVIGWQTHPIDSSPYFADGGVTGAERRDNTLVELDGTGGERMIWSSYPDILPDEITHDPEIALDPARFETVHANAVGLAPDGNLLISCRQISQILKVDRATGVVIWRLGGKRSDFTFLDDPLGGFSLQHDPRFTAQGWLRVVDNGNLHTPQETRIVEYELDEAAKTARLRREVRHLPAVYSWQGGSARDVPVGRLLIDYAYRGTVSEIDDQDVVRWELRTPHSGSYRAMFVPELYP